MGEHAEVGAFAQLADIFDDSKPLCRFLGVPSGQCSQSWLEGPFPEAPIRVMGLQTW